MASYNYAASCTRLFRHARGFSIPDDIRRAIFLNKDIAEAHESGAISELEFFERVKDALHIPNGLSFEQFEAEWGNIFTPNRDIEQLLERLASDVRRYVISNTDPIHWRRIETLTVIQKYFPQAEQQVLSFRVKARKPYPAIYDEACERAGVCPKETLYIDDIHEFVSAWVARGGNGFVYNCDRDPITKLESVLAEHRLLV